MKTLTEQYTEHRQKITSLLEKRIESTFARAGMTMEKVAITKLRDNKKYASNRNGLIDSIRSSVKKDHKGFSLVFGAYAKSSKGFPYPAAIEFGRGRSRKRDDSIIPALMGWVKEKISLGHIPDKTDSEINSFVWAIRKAKAKRKTKAFPFMTPGWKAGKKQAEKELGVEL